ncbi:MAG TPA: chloride channel protein [Verrucomicrobiae bacterium]|jgi:H+/Cl- antiporter ClcA|nr:chloride channel protein [Verrucomicrobiae bacterium]
MPNPQTEAQPNIFGYEGSPGFSPTFWGLVVLTGVGAGLGGGLLMELLRSTLHLAWSYNSGDFLTAASKSTSEHRIAVLLVASLVVAAARHVFQRLTGGHGGEIASAIWFRSGDMPFFHTIGRAIVSIVVVALGEAVGREAAPKQVGGAVASGLAKRAKLSSPQRRLLVACGAGAGMAAVYNVPLGGAIFALEVLLGELSLSLVLPALATSLIAVAVSWIFLPNQPTYSFPVYPFSWIALAGTIVLGSLAGLASVLYVKAISWADAVKPRGHWVAVTPVLVLTGLGIASIAYPQLLGNGKDVVELAFLDQLGLPLLAILVVPRALATIGCLASGAAGGLFTPTLTVGALIGGLFGHLWNQILPGEPAAAYAIFGAGAVLAASTKGPLSALVLVFELTDHVTALAVPLILTIAVATLLARHFDVRSVYSARIHLGKAAAREMKHEQVISAAAHYAEVLKRLLALSHKNAPLYVVDEDGKLVGEITAARAAHAEKFARPLEAASADDLATLAKAPPSFLA